jgi:hypothetical protein
MEQTFSFDVPAKEAKQIQAQMREYIAEMQRSNERIKKDQEEIDRLKAKTRANLAELAQMQGI